ncbi:MAG: GAF domain-containing protein [Coleofasciculaceae cyanobacterium]
MIQKPHKSTKFDQNRGRGEQAPEQETFAIVPVKQEQPQSETPSTSLKAKASALAEELTLWRSNIDLMADQIQSLLEREGAAAERAQMLNEITSHLRESLNPADIFNVVVEDARQALQADRVLVYQFDRHWQGKIVAEAVDADWPVALGIEITDPCFTERYVKLYQKGRVQAVENIYEAGLTDCHISQLEPFEVKANLVTPIITSEQLRGLLIAHQCADSRQWTDSEIEFFRQLATQLGYALDQALLLEQQRTVAQQAQRLNEISSRIRQSLNAEDIFTAVVEETRDALTADRVVVYHFDANYQGTVVAESVEDKWPTALGAEIDDPCFAQRYVQSYLRGRVKAINNIDEADLTECYLKQLKPFEVKANLVAPIVVSQKLLGLLIAHQCSGPRIWTELEIDLLRQVSRQVGYALEQAFALQQQQVAAKQARLLNEVTTRLRQSVSNEEVFESMVEEARDALQAERVIVYQFDPNWHGTVVAESVAPGWPVALGKKIADPCFANHYFKAYLRGRVRAMNNIYEAGLTECYMKMLEPFAVKANIVAPIIAETKLHGLLIVHQCSKPRVWQQSEIDFTKQLATQVGFALDQVFLLQQQKAATEQARRLNQISSHIRESLQPEYIFKAAVEDTQAALQTNRVVVYQFDSQWQGTVVAEAVGYQWPTSVGAQIADPCFAEHYVRQYSKGRVQAINNIYEAGLSECHLRQLEPLAVKANLVAPILAEKKLHSLLIAHQCDGPRIWLEGEIDFFTQVATQVGYALDQAFLLQQQQAAATLSRQLNEISLRIQECLEIEQVYRVAVEESLKLMQADRIVLYRFGANWDGQIVAESVRQGWLKISDWTKRQNYNEEVSCFPTEYIEPYCKGKVWVQEDISQAGLTACHEEQLKKWQVRANVVVPILCNQSLYGLLAVHQCSSSRQWRQSEIEVFKQVALQVGYALDQALLIEQVQQARQAAEEISQEQREQKELLQGQIETFLEEIESSFGGDLTVRAKVTTGEMGTVADFFNSTIENLQQLVLQVQASANVTTNTAQERAMDVKNLSSEAMRQAEAITSALSQLQVMATSIQGVATNSQNAELKVQEANRYLEAGDVAMNLTVEGILAIEQTVSATAAKVKQLGEASQKISRVVNLISDIASQTNLLALNASVEATRAGEDERGFALVAEEVRTLAEQSASATKEIEEIVEETQAETNAVVKAMEAGIERVIKGTQLVQKTRKTLTDIGFVSSQINQLVEEIAQSATAQAQVAANLSNTVQEAATIAEQTSRKSLTLADSFTQLLGVAGKLQESVAQFKVD